jgi:hypothetical protein
MKNTLQYLKKNYIWLSCICIFGLLTMSVVNRKADPIYKLPFETVSNYLTVVNAYSITPTHILTVDATGKVGKTAVAKRQETYSGTTSGSGTYTVTFGTSYSSAPNIQAKIVGGTNTNLIKITSVSTNGFTVTVVNRTDVIGLLPSYSNVNGATVDVLITQK